jgi:hypothetical protein
MTSKVSPNIHYRLLRVKRSDGRLTTVSLDPKVVAEAVQVMGGLRPVSTLVREFAFQYTDADAKNCSSYVEAKLLEAISGANSEVAATRDPSNAVENTITAKAALPPPAINAMDSTPTCGGEHIQPGTTYLANNSNDALATQAIKEALDPLSPYFMDLLLKCARNEHRTPSNMLEYLVLKHAERLQILA